MGESASWLGRVLVLFRHLSNLTINNWALGTGHPLIKAQPGVMFEKKIQVTQRVGVSAKQKQSPFPAQAEKSPVQLETTGFWAQSQGSGDIYNLKRVGVPNKLLYSFSITSLSKATASSERFSTQNACFS